MNLNPLWQAVRVTLIVWLMMLTGGGMVMAYVFYQHAHAEEALRSLEQQVQQARARYASQASYWPDVHFYQIRRQRWQAQGLTREANLDQWVDAWLQMQQQEVLAHLQYLIQPAVSCTGVSCRPWWPTPHPPGFNLSVTQVQLDWTVMHEADVTDWLQRLSAAYAGMMLVRGCRWSVAEGAHAIQAQCDLTLFNFPDALPAELAQAI